MPDAYIEQRFVSLFAAQGGPARTTSILRFAPDESAAKSQTGTVDVQHCASDGIALAGTIKGPVK